MKNAIHGLGVGGSFVHGPYKRRTRLGRTEEYREPQGLYGRTARSLPGRTSDLYHLFKRLVPPAIERLGEDPVVIMVHGFLFDPRDSISNEPSDSDNPHSRLYHFNQVDPDSQIRHHTTSWPLGLGFTETDLDGRDGLILAFGWHSRPGFALSLITRFQNFYARAYSLAEEAAWNLLTATHLLAPYLPDGKRIDFFCHSLGSRVVIRLFALLAKYDRTDLLERIGRVIILGGSEYVVEARVMLHRLDQVGMADRIEFYNVVSRENDVLDKLGENFGPITFGNSNVIGHNGLDVEDPANLGPSWIDLQIDSSPLQRWIAAYTEGRIRVTGDNPNSIWDHWYYFTDPGNMALYHDILRNRAYWSIPLLRRTPLPVGRDGSQITIPDRVSRRRSIFGD
ncbi:MAG: hypothetical protein AAGG65_20515 [Pseudomonadota bacterium]